MQMQPVYGQPQPPSPTAVNVPVVTMQVTENSFKMELEPTISLNGETYNFDAPPLSQAIKDWFCPCRAYVSYKSSSGKHLKYHNGCMFGPPCLRQNWKASVDGNVMGSTNGYKSKLCACDCLSNISIQEFRDANNEVKYTLKKQNDCLSCMCGGIFEFCAPLGFCIRSVSDCFAYCGDKQYVVSKEDIMDATGEKEVGEIIQVHRIKPVPGVPCICARAELKYQINANNPEAANDLALMGLLPMFYSGMEVPAGCCVRGPAPPLSGVSCADRGRNGEAIRCDLDGVVKAVAAPRTVRMM